MEDIALICGVSRALVYSDRERGKFDPVDLRSVALYVGWRLLGNEVGKTRQDDDNV